MSIDERARHTMYQRLEEILGSEVADTVMAHLPPSGWGDVARVSDLDAARVATASDLARVETEIRADLARVETELSAAMRVGFAEIRTEMHRSQRSLAVSLIGVTAAMNSIIATLVVLTR